MKNKKIFVIILGIIVGLTILGGFTWYKARTIIQPVTTVQAESRAFTIAELAQYDGTDPSKPIYLAMNGLVYDITAGKKFYQKGGGYNWLAGKDSSKDLNLIGGDIIKAKYPVIGKLVQ